jgi:putative lipase involved disintegration of autophagic bodies
LRRAGLAISPVTGWEDHDGDVRGSVLVSGQLVTTGHLGGTVLARMRRRIRRPAVVVVAVALALAASRQLPLVIAISALACTDAVWGVWRTGPVARRALRGDACSRTSR